MNPRLREMTVAGILSERRKELEALKSSQRIGNDNFVIRHYEDSLSSEFVNGTAEFEAKFVFDSPSTAFVSLSVSWETSEIFNYEQVYYDLPATLGSDQEHSLVLAISIPDGGLLDTVTATADSTEKGTLTLARTL